MTKKLNKEEVKTLALSSLGGTLEFYDFIIFVFFAGYFQHHFFPLENEFWQEMNTYGAFAAAYLARPLGGVAMAHFGDKFGRKNMFMLSILLMVIPTFALAFIPTYETIGYAAPVLLLLVRIFQGMAIGGELPGAWVFVREHSEDSKKGLFIGLLTSSVVGGILLGSIVALIMTLNYTKAELSDWAWRIPFALGGVFGIVSIYLRRYLNETPVFQKMQKDSMLVKLPIKEVLNNYKFSIFISILITWVLTACVVVFVLLMPNFALKILKLEPVTNTLIQMFGIFSMMIGCISTGYLSDKFGISKICKIFALCWAIFGSFYFYEVYIHQNFNLFVVSYLLSCFFAGIMNFTPLIMLESFPAKIRYSGISFSYNLAYAIAGAITPPLLVFLNSKALEKSLLVYNLGGAIYIVFIAIIAFITAILVQKKM
ncbi:MFS transporter [Campylobacter sp. MG1]|uniref:MFS transporter n=1 Tax=Campylobacter sp. MG1 TaxID=2976332 RepID=UPI00226D0B77|nr:MFS transporter [Campylobacter sp. MG1]